MKIESSIQHILNQKGKVVVPNFGTFSTSQASASVTDSGGVIAPPQAAVSFTEDTSELGAYSLAEYLVSSGKVSESDVELELEAFIKGVNNTVASSGKAGLGSLGYFQKGVGGLEFVSSEGTSMGADSFGLPKITARPLVPVAVTDNTPSTGGGKDNNLLLKAILIPLVILSIVLTYFLVDKETYQAMVAYFNKPSTEVNVPPPVKDKPDNEEPKKGEGDDIVVIDEGKGDGNKTEGNKTNNNNTTDKSDNTTPKDDGSKKTDNTTTTDKSSNTNTDKSAISEVTDGVRFYIIIGSFQTDKGAANKVRKCKALGYKNARVLKMNGKIRVSIEDHADKATAKARAAKLGKDYPGAWPLAHKL